MGFFEGREAEAYDRTYRDRDLVRRMAGYFRPHLHRLAVAALATLVISAAGAATPILVSRGVDWMTSAGAVSAMFVLAGALFGMGIVIWLANWVRRALTTRAVGDAMLSLRRDAFAAAAEHDLSFYSQFASGRALR